MISACRLHFLIRRKVVGGSSEVRPRDVCLISGSGYSKDKQFEGAKLARKVKKQKRPTDQSVRRLRLAVHSVAPYKFSDGP